MELDEEIHIVSSSDDEEYDLREVYEELFMLKLGSLLRIAYKEIKEDKPSVFLIKTHDRWPLLIADNE
ncbi:hypothetical protein [Winogradskyella wichelsiae]|uniref:hypothetical protein n=1 Tax=Winogradskyella wichelsiae TaxID=2697007 RepID=UPI003EF23A83